MRAPVVFFWFVGMLASLPSAYASIDAPASTTGPFTVSWTDVSARYQLRESHDGGATWTVIFEGAEQRFDVPTREIGTYRYNVALCLDIFSTGTCDAFLPVFGDPTYPDNLQSATVEVLADVPPVDSGSIIRDVPISPALDTGPRDATGQCLGTVRLFAGTSSRCRKPGVQTAFQNCCDNELPRLSDTLGETGGRSQRDYVDEASAIAVFDNQCDVRDQETALLADSGFCVEVGTFCAEEIPLVGCVQESRAYCCFGSQLAALIQAQGRAQLPALGDFGPPERPNCAGFTVEQFQSIDMSRLDLSGYYRSIRTRASSLLQQEATDATRHRLDGG